MPSRAEEAAEPAGGHGGRPSLKDVARVAGVSVMTVSNVVRGAPNVSPVTRQRVLRVVKELGYQPNAAARDLRAGRSQVVSLALPHLDNPYFAELARRMLEEAAGLGWTVLIEQTAGSAQGERDALAGSRPSPTEGLVLFPQTLGPAELAEEAGNRPLVLLGDRGHRGPGDVVVVDNEGAAQDAVTHLLSLGRRHIAALGDQPPDGTEISRRRLAGYRAALARAGLPYRPELVVPTGPYSRAEGAAALARLLDEGHPVDAVFALNDLLAVGALHTAVSRGLRVPRDLAIVGFDDIDEARYSNPPLTTVAPDKPGIAREAMRMLHERVTDGRTRPFRTVRLEHRLHVRASTVGATAAAGTTPTGSRVPDGPGGVGAPTTVAE